MLNSLRYLSVAASALCIMGAAQADGMMKLDGVDVPITNVSFSVSRQAVVDPESFMPVAPARSTLASGAIYVTRTFDAASAKVLQHVIDGEAMPKFEIIVSDSAATTRTVWMLSSVVVNNYSTFMDETGALIESFDVTYDSASLQVFAGAGKTLKSSVSWTATAPAAEAGHGE
ncbi:type VI secretion system tube protein Hcp [Hyphomonas oceanitis]|uniref:type VI secretion system tube protein Hcp n=1 Tax=Hyphomonas oceanitis TaxID=81033 RepID=UPI003001F2CB